MALEPSSHGYGQCAYHIVLVPRYRHRVFLNHSLQKRCEELLQQTAANNGYRIFELQVASDHVRLFIALKPTQSVSDAIRLLKCNIARTLSEEYPELRKKFRTGHFWSDGKFYRSIGQVTAETIQHYIARSAHV